MASEKVKKYALIPALLLLLLFSSFQEEKKVKQLPPITHSGENIFACNVDGLLMIANENISDVVGDFGIKFSHARANQLIYIQGSCASPQYDIELCFKFMDTLGTYPLIMNYPYYAYFWNYSTSSSPNATNQFQPDATHGGTVNITYYDGHIISGTFAFDAINRSGDVVHVTDGRFDISKQ